MELGLVELKKIVDDLESEIRRLEEKKHLIFLKTQPSAIKFDKEIMQGGLRTDRFLVYVSKKQSLEHTISMKRDSLSEYNDELIQRVDELSKNDIGGYIRYLRNICNKQWGEIADITSYSISTCQRKYKKDLT